MTMAKLELASSDSAYFWYNGKGKNLLVDTLFERFYKRAER